MAFSLTGKCRAVNRCFSNSAYSTCNWNWNNGTPNISSVYIAEGTACSYVRAFNHFKTSKKKATNEFLINFHANSNITNFRKSAELRLICPPCETALNWRCGQAYAGDHNLQLHFTKQSQRLCVPFVVETERREGGKQERNWTVIHASKMCPRHNNLLLWRGHMGEKKTIKIRVSR